MQLNTGHPHSNAASSGNDGEQLGTEKTDWEKAAPTYTAKEGEPLPEETTDKGGNFIRKIMAKLPKLPGFRGKDKYTDEIKDETKIQPEGVIKPEPEEKTPDNDEDKDAMETAKEDVPEETTDKGGNFIRKIMAKLPKLPGFRGKDKYTDEIKDETKIQPEGVIKPEPEEKTPDNDEDKDAMETAKEDVPEETTDKGGNFIRKIMAKLPKLPGFRGKDKYTDEIKDETKIQPEGVIKPEPEEKTSDNDEDKDAMETAKEDVPEETKDKGGNFISKMLAKAKAKVPTLPGFRGKDKQSDEIKDETKGETEGDIKPEPRTISSDDDEGPYSVRKFGDTGVDKGATGTIGEDDIYMKIDFDEDGKRIGMDDTVAKPTLSPSEPNNDDIYASIRPRDKKPTSN